MFDIDLNDKSYSSYDSRYIPKLVFEQVFEQGAVSFVFYCLILI